MTFFKDFQKWFNDMGTLPWYIKLWASMYPLPQIIGGLIFILTVPGALIFGGRVLSSIIQSRIHKREPFAKMMGPIGHAHWVLIVPYLIYVVKTEALSTPLFWFVIWVIVTSIISLTIDLKDTIAHFRGVRAAYKR